MFFSSTVAFSVVLSLASGAVIGKRALSGQATFYGGNLAGGTCSFSTYTLPSGILGTALSDSNWDDAAECGACVLVTGPSGNSITAMIVDECPGCGLNHLDFFPDAFSMLANPTVGVIDVTWDYIDCPITSPLQVHNKEGVSQWWFSMQVVNANQAISTLEVSTDGGNTWQSTTRQPYNFFENSSGFGTATVDVKVTSVNGDVVIIGNVGVSPDLVVTASANFGTSGTATTVAAVVASASSRTAAVLSYTPVSEPSAATATTTSSAADFLQTATTSSTTTLAPKPSPSAIPDIPFVTVIVSACPA